MPFNARGWPCEKHSVWDLRVGRRVQLTGGSYEGDEGTIIGKDGHGHVMVAFINSVHPDFRGSGGASPPPTRPSARMAPTLVDCPCR